MFGSGEITIRQPQADRGVGNQNLCSEPLIIVTLRSLLFARSTHAVRRNGDDLHPMFGQFPCVRPVHLHPVRFTPQVAAGAWAFVFPPGEADCHEPEAEVATRVWVCFRAGVCSPGGAQA